MRTKYEAADRFFPTRSCTDLYETSVLIGQDAFINQDFGK